MLLLGSAPLFAQAAASQQEEVVCQLLNNCGDSATETPASPAPRTGGRTSNTRGFSLARPTAEPAAPAAKAPAAAPSRAPAMASNRAAPTPAAGQSRRRL